MVSARTLPGVVCCALLLLLALTCQGARAEQAAGAPISARAPEGALRRPLRISLQPGVTCLSEPAFTRALSDALAGSELPTGVEVEVVGSSHDPRSVSLRIRYADGSEFVRAFSPAPERCEHLHQTVALALALTLKASADSTRQADTGPSAAAPDGQPARAPVANELAIGVGGVIAPGLLGNIAGGAQLLGSYLRRHLGLRAGVLGLRSSEQTMPRSGQYTVALAAARLDVCGRLGERERLALELCAGPLAGMYFIEGAGLPQDSSARLRFLGLSVGLDVLQPLGKRFVLRGSAALITTLQPVTVVARDRAGRIVDRQDLSRVGGALLLGIDYRFE